MDRIFKKIEDGEKVLIIGIGNRLKGDDGAGSIIAEKLKEILKKENVYIIDAENKPENYIGKIKKISPSLILIIDCADFNSFPGDFRILNIDEVKEGTISTHNFSIPLLKKLIGEIEIYLLGIQPEKISFGENLSFSVLNSIKKILNLFCKETS